MGASICLPIGSRVGFSSTLNRSRRRRFLAGEFVSSVFSNKKNISYSSNSILKPYLSLSLCNSTQFQQKRWVIQCASSSHGRHDHDHYHEEHKHSQNQDHDHHHHHHHHGGECLELSNSQKAVLKFAKAIGWTDLAEFLRENLQLCCCSAALLLCAAVCPYLVPKSAAKLLRNAFISIAFPLVGV